MYVLINTLELRFTVYSINQQMQWKDTLVNIPVNDRGCIVPEPAVQLQIPFARIFIEV